MATKFTQVTTQQAKNTLARDFIGLADDLRDMLTQFGLRTYSVSTVRIQWSGGKRGRGTPVVTEQNSILPTPKIGSLDGLQELVQNVGISEIGSLELSQVSGRFTEEQLRGFSEAGEGLPQDTEFFYEIEFFPNDTGPSRKRRFTVMGAPTYFPGRLQWSVRLEKSNDDRARNGDPQGSLGT
jgi:hypothetical protein